MGFYSDMYIYIYVIYIGMGNYWGMNGICHEDDVWMCLNMIRIPQMAMSRGK